MKTKRQSSPAHAGNAHGRHNSEHSLTEEFHIFLITSRSVELGEQDLTIHIRWFSVTLRRPYTQKFISQSAKISFNLRNQLSEFQIAFSHIK